MDFDYTNFTQRNLGYISEETQQRLSETKLLIAGCGMGSAPAICATRTGFTKFILVDGDTVGESNLNRQFYRHGDIGSHKTSALQREILSINPKADVRVYTGNLTTSNVSDLVSQADIIFDTIDFVDLEAVLALHDEALKQKKPLITAINVGFGAFVWYIPPSNKYNWAYFLREDMNKVSAEGGDRNNFGDVYLKFIDRIKPNLDAEVVEVIDTLLLRMKENQPCPAPQLAVGSFSVAALAVTMMHDILAGNDVVSSPELVIQSYRSMRTRVVSLL